MINIGTHHLMRQQERQKNQHRRRDIISKPYKCKYCGYFHIGQSMGNKINKKLLAMCDCVV